MYIPRPAHAVTYADEEFIGGRKEERRGGRGGGGEDKRRAIGRRALSQASAPMRAKLAFDRAPVDGGNNNFATHTAPQPGSDVWSFGAGAAAASRARKCRTLVVAAIGRSSNRMT